MSTRRVVIFEDRGHRGLYPATLSRPTFSLRTGATTLGRRLMAQLAERDLKQVELVCRTGLRPLVERGYLGHSVNDPKPGDTLFLNGRLLCLGNSLDRLLELLEKSVAVTEAGVLVGARLTGSAARTYQEELLDALEAGEPAPLPVQQSVGEPWDDLLLVRHLWDLVNGNERVIRDDFDWARRHPHPDEPELAPGARLVQREHILFREKVTVEPGAVLDARGGPIILGDDVHIEHGAIVLGPVALGPGTRVRMGARVYDAVSTGPVCRVGGEVEATILQGYANKQHEGFLGHAYVGAWTNLGAGTNNSDLRNDYRNVSVWTPDGPVDTGSLFAGLYLGDHSKTAIGTRFNTGTVVGFSCNLFGSAFPPRHVPSFTWLGEEGPEPYRLDKALATARTVMARRKVTLEPADEVLFRAVREADGHEAGGG